MAEKLNQYVFLVGLIVLLHDWGMAVLAPSFLSITTEFGLDPQQLSLLLSTYSLPGIVMSPVYGALSDRIGRRKVITPLILLFTVAGIGSAFAPTYSLLLGFRLFQGIAVAGFYPLAIIVLGDLFTGDKRGYAVGNLYTILRVASIITPLIGGFLALISWRWAFLSFAIGLPIILGILYFLPETRPHLELSDDDKSLDSIESVEDGVKNSGLSKYARSVKIYLIALFLGLCLFLVFGGCLNLFMPYYIQLGLQLTPADTGIILSLRSIIVTLMNLQIGRLMTRRSKPALTMIGFFFFATGFAILALPPSLPNLILGVIFTALPIGIIFPVLNSYILDLTQIETRGTSTSIYQSIAKIGQTIGPFLFATSYAMTGGILTIPFLLAAIVSAGAGFLAAALIGHASTSGIGMPENYIQHKEKGS